MKRSLFILQIILGIFLLFFIYKQMNQNHLDTWFILYTVFFIFFSSWFDKHYKKIDDAFMPRKFIDVEKNP
ncbi:hypothetical protein G6Y73_09405 [Staphylococcus aureus]|nr:hypothetical protein [Staphylococcus aureus]